MSMNTRLGYPTYKAKVAFVGMVTVLGFGAILITATYDQWFRATIHTVSLKEAIVMVVTTGILVVIGNVVLVNLFGIAVALITPRRRLKRWNPALTKYYYSLYILRKFIDWQQKPRYYTP